MKDKTKRILITGSSSGLGQMAAKRLVEQGHIVVLHGRSPQRANEALQAVPGAKSALYGNFDSMEQIRHFADQANQFGHFDAIIHNAAIGDRESTKKLSEDGLPRLFSINVLAPYMLTALIDKPERLIYISSSMQFGVNAQNCLGDMLWTERLWQGSTAYSESKLLISLLAFTIARCWPQIYSNTVDPGWVPTRMGGQYASDDLNQGYLTQSWLAASDDKQALVSGHHFYHMRIQSANPDALDAHFQNDFISQCQRISGISLLN